MSYEVIARVLALKEKRFTRWHELSAYNQYKYLEQAKDLVKLGAEHDSILKEFKENTPEKSLNDLLCQLTGESI